VVQCDSARLCREIIFCQIDETAIRAIHSSRYNLIT